MADFFVFVQTLVSSFLKPLMDFLLDNKIAVFLGAPLLFVLAGFWIARLMYNVFISHRDNLGASVVSESVERHNASIERQQRMYENTARQYNRARGYKTGSNRSYSYDDYMRDKYSSAYRDR